MRWIHSRLFNNIESQVCNILPSWEWIGSKAGCWISEWFFILTLCCTQLSTSKTSPCFLTLYRVRLPWGQIQCLQPSYLGEKVQPNRIYSLNLLHFYQRCSLAQPCSWSFMSKTEASPLTAGHLFRCCFLDSALYHRNECLAFMSDFGLLVEPAAIRIGKAGGVQDILSALRAFSDNAGLATTCCGALWSLCVAGMDTSYCQLHACQYRH